MRIVNVEKYLIPLFGTGEIDEELAAEGWRAIIKAQGWTPVGDPDVVYDDAHGQRGVIGRLVRAKVDGEIRSDATSIKLP